MPQQGIEKLEDSLFSLELVVEKLYIPHTPCRFPAIAFRLLDFPTIVIKHVDDELGTAIRRKISFDQSYRLPDQFIELKDKHGNFMINKGKSCLMRMPADILRQHLANTPLYVMVIDLFPEVPKLVGNSSVPLNTLMDLICVDIAKVGPTVPSVHGDKGLFKLYNLMGNEIGYFVLGFRLLCLGPSLIPHLPESILLQKQSKSRQVRKNLSSSEVIHNHLAETEAEDDFEVELRNSACMTDPVKNDVMLQTVEMHDKAVLVGLFDSSVQTEAGVMAQKASHSLATQTEKRTQIKEAQSAQQKWFKVAQSQPNEYEDVIINNIVCPPPLFYNSKASPRIKIDRQQSHPEEFIDDLSDIHSYDGQGLENVETHIEEIIHQDYIQPGKPYVSPKRPVPQARAGETVKGLQVAPNPSSVFPLLTALLNELSCIQNPQLLLNVSNQMQAASQKIQESSQSPNEKEQIHQIQKKDKLSPTAVYAVAAALARKIENSTENGNIARSEKPSRPKNSQTSAMLNISKQEIKQGQKQTFVHPPKKSKLVYGMTHTQRLRLQKTNPQWLKTAERKMPNLTLKTQPPKKETETDEISAELLSDTLTEVRRLAEKELNNTASEDTLLNVTKAGESSLEPSTEHPKNTVPGGKDKNTKLSTRKSKQVDTNKRPVGGKSNVHNTYLLKSGQKHNRSMATQQNEMLKDTPGSGVVTRTKPVPQMRQFRNITSPPYDDQEFNAEVSPDQASSKNHSVEVSLPSPDDSSDNIPLPDDSLVEKGESLSINFPKYLSKDISLPESIDGTVNASLNISEGSDDQSPLESTRQSKNIVSDHSDSKVLQSVDYDTRQFQSTDEPELQDLLSEEENPSNGAVRSNVVPARGTQPFPVINPQLSENSPVPSVRRSTNKQDPTMHSYIPSFSQKLESSSSSRSTAKKSNSVTAVEENDDNDFKAQYDPFQKIGPNIKNLSIERNDTPSSTTSSPRRPTPQPRKPTPRSLHTDSLSSYMPSDPDNVVISLSSYSGNYSDDFQLYEVDKSKQSTSSVEIHPKVIPNSKLGYTIN
ncbi:unnamed protein product [Candidula unifasciata]|uniref:Microtubule-associated protein 10 n=1 Tax=Candidula unifasciata TaxID=100452 RepID=A0A8S3ZXR4_9EUPU|nr:unnamed protein product [Candidula unifasciata]